MDRSGFASKCTDFAAQVAIGAALLASLLTTRPTRADTPALPPPPAISATAMGAQISVRPTPAAFLPRV